MQPPNEWLAAVLGKRRLQRCAHGLERCPAVCTACCPRRRGSPVGGSADWGAASSGSHDIHLCLQRRLTMDDVMGYRYRYDVMSRGAEEAAMEHEEHNLFNNHQPQKAVFSMY